jgi:undecaprenyl-diphosphatase
MTIFQSIFLGIIQGLTEFLPISSSGHLVIVPHILNWDIPAEEAFIFDVLVQVATLIAVIGFFWQDYLHILREMIQSIIRRAPFDNERARLGWYILLATIPAGIAGLMLKDAVENAFASPLVVSLSLFGTAILLVIAEKVGKRSRELEDLNWLDALIVGLFQVLALFPGISRSGATITGGMTRNMERPAAARFAFLIAAPIMLAAGLGAVLDLSEIPNMVSLLPVYIPGFIAAAVVGYLAIGWLISFLNRYSLYYFAAYCGIVGLISLLVLVL